jgi:hypothetical protein
MFFLHVIDTCIFTFVPSIFYEPSNKENGLLNLQLVESLKFILTCFYKYVIWLCHEHDLEFLDYME